MTNIVVTSEQQAVISYDKSLVVIARPGSGKTLVLSLLIKKVLDNLPAHRGVIAISYTNKASDELKKRSTSDGADAKSSFFGTIDKFCDSEVIIPFLPHLWGMPSADVTVIKITDLPEDEQEQFSDVVQSKCDFSAGQLQFHLSSVKSYYQKGILFLEANGVLAQYVIENSVACQRFLQKRYSHVIVDEYQDSGLEQHALFLKIQELGLVAIAVGDPDQSIFGFSNKDPKHLLSLAQNNKFKTFSVTKNHRSHPSIVNYSLKLLDQRYSPIPTDSIRVFHKHCSGGTSSISAWIDSTLEAMMQTYECNKRSEVGILARSGRTCEEIHSSLSVRHRYLQAHPLETHLSLWSKLFVVLLSYRYDKSKTVQEIIDGLDTKMIVGDLRKVKAEIKKVRAIDSAKLFDHLERLAGMLLPNAQSAAAVQILREADVSELPDFFKPAEDDEVQVMTLHKSKGLEFNVVFHLDLHEWVLPAKQPGVSNDFNNPVYTSMEEDRKLHYVGITRARKACVFCTSDQRTNSRGRILNADLSEFLTQPHLTSLRDNL